MKKNKLFFINTILFILVFLFINIKCADDNWKNVQAYTLEITTKNKNDSFPELGAFLSETEKEMNNKGYVVTKDPGFSLIPFKGKYISYNFFYSDMKRNYYKQCIMNIYKNEVTIYFSIYYDADIEHDSELVYSEIMKDTKQFTDFFSNFDLNINETSKR